MKKLFFSAVAFATLLFAASCQQENLDPALGGNGVTFTIEAPAQVQTKATIGDGMNVNKLVYEVWMTKNYGVLTEGAQKLYQSSVDMQHEDGKNTAKITLDLVNDQKYTVLFWAQVGDTYNTKELTAVGYKDLAALKSNNESLAAFYAVAYVNDSKHVTKEGTPASSIVTLRRPFAQLNLGTKNTSTEYTVSLSQSKMRLADVPTVFNVATSEASDEVEVVFNMDEVPGGKLPLSDYATDEENPYFWAGMNYVFAGSNLTVEYDIETVVTATNETVSTVNVNNTIENVPVRENHRTNIIGNLLTSRTDYIIVVDADFNTNDNSENMEILEDGIVKNINGDYEITTENGLAYAINNLFVDANGVANANTFYVKPGIYDMANQAIKDIEVISGTLKVYDTEAVVTRSVMTAGVVIEGLKKAIIKNVHEGATVFFSGITIKDFKGDAQEDAALVQNNAGKVVLAGCQLVDDEGKLVGGNEPIAVKKGEEEAGELIYTAEQLAKAFEDEKVETIALGADIALENTLVFPEGRKATLDLRGWVLTVAEPEATYALNNYGTLTIKDSYLTGAVKARGIYNGYVAEGVPVSTAKLTIESGTFNAMGTNGGAAVYNYGQVEVKGGAFTSIGGYSLNNQSGASMSVAEGVKINNGIYNNGAALTINGGEIEGNRSGCHVVYSYNSTVTINGGTIHNNNSGNSTLMAAGTSEMTVNGGTFSIKDGRVEGNGNTWTSCLTDTQNTASLTVNGGTFNGGFRVQGGTTMTIIGGVFNDIVGSGYNVYAGANVVITGASFNYDVNKWCHKDYKAVKNPETAMWEVVAKNYVVQIGEEKYESLQEAFNEAVNEQTIKLLKDIILAETADFPKDKIATLDLNGQKISVVESTGNHIYALRNEGNLTLCDSKGNGSISARGIYNGSPENTTAKMTIENGAFNGIDSNGGAAVFNYADLTVKGGEYYGGKAAINMNSGTVTIKGGTFSTPTSGSYAIQNNGGQLNINNATVESGFGAVGNYKGTTVIEDGCFYPTGREAATCHVVYVASVADVTIKGGTFKMNYPEDAVPDSGSAVANYSNGKVNISGGTFYSHFDNVSPVELSDGSCITGGTYYTHSGNPSDHQYIKKYVAEGYELVNGVVQKEPQPVAKVGNTEYKNIDEAVAAWGNGSTLTLIDNVTLNDVIKLKSTEHHILNLGTYTLTAASNQHAIEITCEGRSSASYALTVNADATNPGGITAKGKSCIYYKKSGSTKDRPIILINNGVFTGSYSINSTSDGNTNCPQIWINGGVFNSYMNLTKNMLRVSGGTFHGAINCTGDSSAYREIKGGRFKSWQFMTADAPNKFWVGSGNGNYDVGVYVDDEGYLVVGGPVITEFGDKFQAKATNYSKWSSYLKYSSAAEYGLYYTNAELAVKKHGETNVTLKQVSNE